LLVALFANEVAFAYAVASFLFEASTIMASK
jgi:hypothetical protein